MYLLDLLGKRFPQGEKHNITFKTMEYTALITARNPKGVVVVKGLTEVQISPVFCGYTTFTQLLIHKSAAHL